MFGGKVEAFPRRSAEIPLLLKSMHGQVLFSSFNKFLLYTIRPSERSYGVNLEKANLWPHGVTCEKANFCARLFCLDLRPTLWTTAAPVLNEDDRTFEAPTGASSRLIALRGWEKSLHYHGIDSFVFISGPKANIPEKEKVSQWCALQKSLS